MYKGLDGDIQKSHSQQNLSRTNCIYRNQLDSCTSSFKERLCAYTLRENKQKIIVIQSIHQLVFDDQSTKFRLNELKDF